MKRATKAAPVLLLLGTLTVALAQQAPPPIPKGEAPPSAKSQTPVQPKFSAVAETRLLMEALNLPNYRGLELILKQNPADLETWTFARGQALLIAETGNLLLLRPPRGQAGQDAWFRRAMDLRQAASTLARTTANRDLAGSRAALARVADACNRCHTTFRVAIRVGPNQPAPREEPSP
jgi:hypothetical protein